MTTCEAERERLELALRKDLVNRFGQLVRPVDPLSYVSGPDVSPGAELGDPDDVISPRWLMEDGTELLLNMTDSPLIIDATGSSEVFSGSTDTDRTMEKGSGEV